MHYFETNQKLKMMRSTICFLFFVVCASVSAQTTVISNGPIRMGIQVYDYENDRLLDISKLCQGFDSEGLPEELVIPYQTQIRIFFPDITEKNASEFVAYSDKKRKLSLDNYNLEFEYNGKLVSNPVNQSSSAGSIDSFGLVYNPNVVSPSNFLKNINLEWRVDYGAIELIAFIKNDEIDERQVYRDSVMNNLSSGYEIFNKDYGYWIEKGFAQNLDQNGLPQNPIIPQGSGIISFITNASNVTLTKGGEPSEFYRFESLSNDGSGIYYFKPEKSGSYELRVNNPNKVYGQTSISYTFSVPFNFWKEGGYYMLGGIGLLGILFLAYRVNTNQKIKRVNLASQISAAELKAVRSQLNPHFLFNALNAIQNLVNKNDNEQANNYIVKLSRLMRKVLAESNEAYHTLEDELKVSKNYIELEQLRKPFQFELDIDDSINMNTLVPNMILQPYLENAVIHGINNNGAERVGLEVLQKNDSLVFKITNDGKQLKSTIEEGQGMKLGQQRLEVINKQFGEGSATVKTHVGIEQFTLEIKLPKHL